MQLLPQFVRSLFAPIWSSLQAIHADNLAAEVKKQRMHEIIRVMEVAHAQELTELQNEGLFSEWPMKIQEQKERIAAVEAGNLDAMIVDRRSWSYPYLPESLHRLNQPILKNTPYNLRRFSETPIPRRAINLIKNQILAKRWEIRKTGEQGGDPTPEQKKRIDILTACLKQPNDECGGWRPFAEAVFEDIIVGGYGCIEPRITPNAKRPIKLWPVDGSTIRIFADWTESTPDRPRYAQMTGLKGERGIVAFRDDELIYIKDNNRSNTPFGLGKLEVSFNSVNYFLGIQDMAGKSGADQVHKTMLWWSSSQLSSNLSNVRRYLTNEIEQQSKISLISGMPKPELIDIRSTVPEDLLLDWQKFLLVVIAQGFDLSAQSIGVTESTSKAIGQVLADADFFSAVYPMAMRFEQEFTLRVVHQQLGWRDLEFHFIGLEDPDPLTKKTIQQRDWMMNSITPDEIRADEGKPPLAGGWGRLTMGQWQMLIMQATAMARPASGGGGGYSGGGGGSSMGMGGGFGSGAGMPSATSGTTMGLPSGGGTGNIGAAGYSADDIAEMNPQDIQFLQEQGLLPPSNDLADQMEQEQPGILQQLTEQLRSFLELEDEYKEESLVQPEPVTNQDQKQQQKRFLKNQHVESYRESVVNDRGLARVPPRPNLDQSAPNYPVVGTQQGDSLRKAVKNRKGKYPRSGGENSQYK